MDQQQQAVDFAPVVVAKAAQALRSTEAFSTRSVRTPH
jgi:hypothetical protein